jgi:hypothetical protein
MRKKTPLRRFGKLRLWQVAACGVLSVVGSFLIGIRTAGEVEPFMKSQAGSLTDVEAEEQVFQPGDVNADGRVDVTDAIEVIKFIRGDTVPTREQLIDADPSGNARFDIDDVLLILERISPES